MRVLRQKVYFVVVAAALVLSFLGVALMLYWALSKGEVLVINNDPVPVRTIREHPTADGVVILKVDFCKKVNTVGKVRSSFVSPSREVFLPMYDDRSDPRCQVAELPVLIPKDLPPGEYHVHYHITYQVNPLKQVVEDFDSKSFKVVD